MQTAAMFAPLMLRLDGSSDSANEALVKACRECGEACLGEAAGGSAGAMELPPSKVRAGRKSDPRTPCKNHYFT